MHVCGELGRPCAPSQAIQPCRIPPLPGTPAASPPRGSRLRGSWRSAAYARNLRGLPQSHTGHRSAGLTGGTRESPSWASPGAPGSSPTLRPREPRRLLRLPPPNSFQACALAEPQPQPPGCHPQPAVCAWATFPWARMGEEEVAAGGGHWLRTGEVFSESESSVVLGAGTVPNWEPKAPPCNFFIAYRV